MRQALRVTDKSFSDHFSSLAAAYAAGRPTYPSELYDWIGEIAPARERAWDCATGNGQAAVCLADKFAAVCATDASAEQLANATPRPNITYSVQHAEHTDFPADCFDAVSVAQAMHWFRIPEFAAEARRVLKPGGVLVAWTYGFFRISPEIDAVIDPGFFQPVEPFWPKEAAIAWSGYRDLVLPLEPIESPQIPMVCRWTLQELTAYLASWSSLRYYTERHGSGPLEQAMGEVAPLWGEADEPRDVIMDLQVRAWRKVPA